MAESARGNSISKIYVGNLPTHITNEEVVDLFHEFPGTKLQNVICKGVKKFCFLECDDERTAIDLVNAKDGLIVMGRNIVVRLCDERKFQNEQFRSSAHPRNDVYENPGNYSQSSRPLSNWHRGPPTRDSHGEAPPNPNLHGWRDSHELENPATNSDHGFNEEGLY